MALPPSSLLLTNLKGRALGSLPPANGYQLERLAARFRKLRERAVSAEGTPARAYLTPAAGLAHRRPGTCPARCGGLRRMPSRTCCAGPLKRCPAGNGQAAVAFQYGGPGKVPAWKLEALTAHGQRSDQAGTGGRWRRNAGSFEGLRFETTDHTAHGQLHVCEGEVTALALAVQCAALGKGFAIAAGGTSGFQVAACRDPVLVPGADPCRPGPAGADRGQGVGAQAPGNGAGGRSGRLA